ncbi:Ig-like domain-containing protein [Radiobacillus kanasensis]|uniref:Ig-like domain-containing protein n=1 Tax=Radiobacillus kanasensis TaxID=2844358 RepID=UPI001E3D9ED3|nr:Ig-like domain-containing protein [Radiobacillus kanasensis]UFT99197.1 Ig-like domain-containing protein [Radiobacillus kanasensis]
MKSRMKKFLSIPVLAIILLTSALLFSSSVSSQSDLEMKITYAGVGGSTWDLRQESDFDEEWLTKDQSVSFTVDLSAYYEKPEDGSEAEVPFEVAATYSNGASLVATPDRITGTGEFEGKYRLDVTEIPDDDGTVEVKLKLKGGNGWNAIPTVEGPITFSVSKDVTAPVVNLYGVEDGELYHDKKLDFVVEVVDEHFNPDGVTITGINSDNEWESSGDGKYYKTFPVTDGDYAVTANAKDKLGNSSAEESVKFSLHNGEPSLEVKHNGTPVEGNSYFNKDTVLDLTVTNAIPIGSAELKVYKDGQATPYGDFLIDGNTATFRETFTESGEYRFEVTVTDKENNYKHEILDEEVRFTIDKVKPELTITDENGEPIVDGFYKSKQVTVEVKEEYFNKDDIQIEVLKDEEPQSGYFENWNKLWNDTYKAIADIQEDGRYEIRVTAKDPAGNQVTDSVSFTIDGTPPELSITGVEDGKHYKTDVEAIINVNDKHIDEENTNLKVEVLESIGTDNWKTVNIGKELEFTDGEAEIRHLFQTEGRYRITLSSKDILSNTEEKVVTFTVDKQAPDVGIDGVTNEAIYSEDKEVTISVDEVNFDHNNVDFRVKRNNEDITDEVEKHAQDNWKNSSPNASFTYEFDKDGFYEISIQSMDAAGNASETVTRKFSIDRNAPSIDVHGVEDQQHYNEDKDVRIRIEDLNMDEEQISVNVTKDGDTYDVGELDVKHPWLPWFGNTVATLDHTFSEVGDYVIEINVVDNTDREQKKVVNFTIDKTEPVLNITGVTDKEFFKESETVIFSAEDLNIDQSDIDLKVETLNQETGEKVPYSVEEDFKIKDGKATFSYTFADEKTYIVTLRSQDKAGNVAVTKQRTFTIDGTAPGLEINIDSKDDNGDYLSSSGEMEVSITETNFKNNDVTFKVTKNGTDITKQVEGDLGSKWRNASKRSELTYTFDGDGSYSIVLEAEDEAGNESIETKNFTIDKVNPSIDISGVNGQAHYNENVPIDIEIKDVNFKTNIVKVSRNGKNYDVGDLSVDKNLYSNSIAKLSHTFKLEGTYRIQVTSIDKADRRDSEEVTFTVDKTAPVLSIDNVDDNDYLPSSRKVAVSVEETNYEENSVQFQVTRNGQDITEQFGTGWTNDGVLSNESYVFNQDGEYSISISAIDKAGNKSTSKQKTFTIDTKRPSIDITGVEDGEYYNESKSVQATIKDVNFESNIIRVTRNGARYQVGGFSVDRNKYADSIATLSHTFSQEGDYEIEVEAIDKAGNRYLQRVSFKVDKTKPVITPNMNGTVIKDGQYINKVFTPKFSLDNSEDRLVSVILNNGSNIAGSIPIASREMVYNYKVVAEDKAGNQTNLNISFTLDTTKPELNISGILEGFFNENLSPRVTYSDIHLDESKTSVTLNGEPFRNGMELEKEQYYELKAVITDLANNVSARTIVFSIDKSAPVIKFGEVLSGQYINETIIPQLLIDDISAYDIISMTLNGEPYELGDPIETEGKHVLYFEVKDKAGNIRQLSIEFIIDKTEPEVVVEGVEKNKTYNEPIDLEIRLNNQEDTFKQVSINGELFEGEVVEEDGYQVMKTRLSEVKAYEVEIVAEDKAGNEITTTIPFELVEPSIFTKLYENKPLFASVVAGLLGIVAAAAVWMRKRNIRNKDLPREEETAS